MTQAIHEQTGKVILGRYRLVMPLAKGGQGVVYLARGEGAAGFTLPVVIKRVLAPIARDPEANERFVREARITAQLRHPDIVSILDFEQESDDSYVMVLEYVHGYDLSKWTRYVRQCQRPFDAELAAYVTIRVLEALHYTHSLRSPNGEPTPIVHRDISPGNVLIDEDGHVKLTDFGIAHTELDRAEEQASSAKRGIQGKLAYMAPEMYRGASPSPQSDLYASAVMLHQLLVDKNEFHAKDLMAAAMLAVQHVPTRVSDVRPEVSAAASDVIARALAKDPKDRHESAREFSVELRRAFNLDLGEMPERLSRAVRNDFFDPRFPELADVMELGAIDRAWREVPSVASLSNFPRRAAPQRPPVPVHGTATGELSIRTVVDPDPGSGAATPGAADTKRETLAWLLLAAVAVAAAIAFVVTRQQGAEERVVFVDAQAVGTEAAPRPAPTPAAPAAPAPAPAPEPPKPEAAAPTAPAPAKRADDGDAIGALTRAFGARKRQIESCFTAHSAALSGAPRLLVDFEVAETGSVIHAGLDPSAVEDTELGRCVLEIARATQFGRQDGVLRFRIPLTARNQ